MRPTVPSAINRRVLLTMLALLPALAPQIAIAQRRKPAAGPAFSFAVYGDSRSMMYLPYKADQREEAIKLMADMFELLFPEKIAEEVVRKYVRLTYDPATDELVQIVMPFDTKSEVTTLTVDKGWVTEASVEDAKLLPGVRRTMFRLQGGEWVAREIVKDVQSGRAKFILNTGDMVWWGKQGRSVSDSPYWKLVYEDVLKQLPAPDRQMRAAGLPGRVFPAVGNHEVWDDSDVEGRSLRIRTRFFHHMQRTWISSSLTATSTRPNSTKLMASNICCWAAVARNRTRSCPVAPASRCQRTMRPISIGRASRPRKSTTTSLWTSILGTRQSSR
jgi:hypothetical protein